MSRRLARDASTRSRGCPSSSRPRTRPRRRIDARRRCPRADDDRQHRRARDGRLGHRRRRARRRSATATLPVPVVVLKQYRTPGVRRAAHARVRGLVLGRHRGDGVDGRAARSTPGAHARRGRRAAASSARSPPSAAALHVAVSRRAPDAARRARRAGRAAVRRRCSASGCCPRRTPVLVKAQQQLARRRDQCRPEVEGAANPARELARRIGRTIPLDLRRRARSARSPRCAGSATSTRTRRRPRSGTAYPELDHNEICGWGQHGDVTRQVLTLVELRHGFEHARLRAALRATTRARSRRRCAQVLEVRRRGRGPARPAARPHVPRRLDELLPRARQRRRPRPDRRHRAAEGTFARPAPGRVASGASVGPCRGCHPVIRADSIVTTTPRRRDTRDDRVDAPNDRSPAHDHDRTRTPASDTPRRRLRRLQGRRSLARRLRPQGDRARRARDARPHGAAGAPRRRRSRSPVPASPARCT